MCLYKRKIQGDKYYMGTEELDINNWICKTHKQDKCDDKVKLLDPNNLLMEHLYL